MLMYIFLRLSKNIAVANAYSRKSWNILLSFSIIGNKKISEHLIRHKRYFASKTQGH